MKTYNKLVRDKIANIIREDNKFPKTRILTDDEYKEALLKKLLEESEEVMNAKDEKDLMKEIGDVQEVLDSIIKAFNLNREEIKKIQEKRKKERGGFEKKLYLLSVKQETWKRVSFIMYICKYLWYLI